MTAYRTVGEASVASHDGCVCESTATPSQCAIVRLVFAVIYRKYLLEAEQIPELLTWVDLWLTIMPRLDMIFATVILG